MDMSARLAQELTCLNDLLAAATPWRERITAQLDYACQLAVHHPAERAAMESVIGRALSTLRQQVERAGLPAAVAAAEAELAPLGPAAKRYTIHCVGHAHIDMNWQWSWPETVAVVNDTLTTVDRLMDEFPAFRFSQSQAAIYALAAEYLPELWLRIKQRVAEGRWEVTAATWVEGDMNLASGESLCRHLLYTRRYLQAQLGLPPEAVQVAFSPDSFGHAATVPGLLASGGIRWYYFHRGARDPKLFWWAGRDGQRVLAFNDWVRGYGGALGPNVTGGLFDFIRATSQPHYLFVYGIGDHGGGPTREDLRLGLAMREWPVFPTIRFSTYADFFTAVEAGAAGLPVHEGELNTVFEGCLTSQANIKRANRRSEGALVEAESYAVLGRTLGGLPALDGYLVPAWRHAMFNQFHDILPGSGVPATYQHAQGLFQEIIARTAMLKTRAVRAIADQVDTRAVAARLPDGAVPDLNDGPGLGVGTAFAPRLPDHGLTSYCPGGSRRDHVVLFNPSPWPRSEVAMATIWYRDWSDGQITVIDDQGRSVPGQVMGRSGYGRYNSIDVAFPAMDLPAFGYRSYCLSRSAAPGVASGVTGDGCGMMENEHLRVRVEEATGAIVSLVDKATGAELVPPGGRLGQLQYVLESPPFMSAWVLGQDLQVMPLTGAVDCPFTGPQIATIRVMHEWQATRSTQTIALAAGSRRLDFTLEIDWRETGSPQTGVPGLRVVFPLALTDTRAMFECPNGHVERPTTLAQIPSYTRQMFVQTYKWPSNRNALNPGVTPGQRWVDLSGDQAGRPVGATLVNDCCYGFRLVDNTITMPILRASFDPDPLPDQGRQRVRYGLLPHGGEWTPAAATRAGHDFNQPLNPVPTGEHVGRLPGSQAFCELLTAHFALSALKPAEDGPGLIVRLYETDGRAGVAHVRLAPELVPGTATACETDLLERPLAVNRATWHDGVLSVPIAPYATATIRLA